MLSSLTVYLLIPLISFVSAGYKLDPFDPKYPNYVHISEAAGHRTWIEIDAIGKKPIYSQIAIMENSNNQYRFAKKVEGPGCVDFYYGRESFEYACENQYSLFAEDYYRFRRVTFEQFLKDGCVTDDKKKVDPIHFKDKEGNRYILMGEKSNMGDVNSPKLIGTYLEKENTFMAKADEAKQDSYVYRKMNQDIRNKFDPKKFEIFCPNVHNYYRKK